MNLFKQGKEMFKQRKELMKMMEELSKDPVVATDSKQIAEVTMDMKKNKIGQIRILKTDVSTDVLVEAIRNASNDALEQAAKKFGQLASGMKLGLG
ncbi:MAG: hypothetical protein Q7T03_09370 [Deltaproteobacteria bacterium]|nr:hypothetical protein [Deltaproteobacteria bacterium]